MRDNKDKLQLLVRARKIAKRLNRTASTKIYSSDVHEMLCTKYFG